MDYIYRRAYFCTMNHEVLVAQNQELERQVQQLCQILSLKDATIEKQNGKLASFSEQILYLKLQLEYLQKQLFGRKSEKFVPEPIQQLNLFQTQTPENPVSEPQPAKTQTVTYERKTNHQGRKLIENCGHLPIIEQIIEVEHQENDIKIGEEITQKIGIEVEKLYIRRIIRHKYKNAQTGEIKIAPMPAEALPKCEADETLLAHVVVSKFVDHTPEYRQQQILKRQGVEIAPSTMNTWTHQIAELIHSIALEIRKSIIASGYLQMDESPIKVLFTKTKGSHQGYMWVMVDPVSKNTYFEYQKGRNREGPKLMLKDFKGKIQSDGYAVYDAIDATMDDVEHYNCWAHARRKYVEAVSNDAKLANEMLVMIQKLYRIEAACREQNLTTEQREAIRADESQPILTQIKTWLDEKSLPVTPASPIGKAMAYTIKRWHNLKKYAQNGIVEIDNNLVENAIRPLALGRKNYLFAGGHAAAQHIATFYTIFSTCKAQGINPHEYMVWLLQNIAQTPINQIQTLTPAAYKARS